jgi:hypothetical protein
MSPDSMASLSEMPSQVVESPTDVRNIEGLLRVLLLRLTTFRDLDNGSHRSPESNPLSRTLQQIFP